MKKLTGLIALLLTIAVTIPVSGQTIPSTQAGAELPARVILEGGTWIHQGVNRCSAAALTIHLSYFMPVSAETYNELSGRDLNTWGADVSVRIEEMALAAQARGFGAVVRRGGTVDLLRELVASGFPVLIENSYYEGSDLYRDWLSHNRVLVGYDDNLQMFYFSDPLLGYPQGALVEYSYTDLESRWRPFNRDYMVIYELDDEATVQAILGSQWDEEANVAWTMQLAQNEIDSGRPDSYSYFNLGWAQVQQGLYEEASASFDTARNIGLPMRMLWYEFGMFEAYLGAERYADVIALANNQISIAGDTISVEEWYYYAARAYEAQGNNDRAILNYQVALARNRNFVEAQNRLTALQGN